jgi:hypothetical protein
MYAMPCQAYIQDSQYINRERMEYSKWNHLHVFLDDPTLKPTTPSESRRQHQAITEFKLTHNKLYRKANTRNLVPRYVVLESEAFDIVTNAYLQLLYTSQQKV